MKRKTRTDREEAEAKSAAAHSEDSRNSTHGYLEMGNDAEVQAKARALRNNDNGSHM
jgi:hypothetical protein